MVWQGLLAGATQALTWTLLAKLLSVRETAAKPLPLVTALAELSDPEPCIMAKFTVAPLFGAPRLTTHAPSGTLTVAPWAIQRLGAATPMSKAEEVAVSVAETDCDGL